MNSIKVAFDVHFQAVGPVDIPAGSEIVFGDDGVYSGYVAADGTLVPHRGQEGVMAQMAAPTPPQPTITITPAPEPEPEPAPEPEPETPAAA